MIASLKDSFGKKSSRLLSLREFHEGYEWCSEAARSILKADQATALELSGIYGLVADHIDVPREYETAVESVLGDKLQYMVVRAAEDGIKAIDYLKTSSAGRGSFIPLEVRNNVNGVDSISQGEAVKLIDTIQVKTDFKSIADYLLGDVLLIPSLHAGISMWRRNGFSGTMVTPEGDIISQYGVLTGGKNGNGSGNGGSLLKNKREMNELQTDIEQISLRLDNETGSKDRLEAGIGDWEDELQEIRSQMRDLEIRTNSKKKDIERYENEMKWVEERLGVLNYNRENLAREESEARTRIESLKEELAANERSSGEMTSGIVALSATWEEARARLESLEKGLTEKRILLASIEEKRNADQKALSRLEADIENLSSEIDSRLLDTRQCEKEASELTVRIAGTRKRSGRFTATTKRSRPTSPGKRN